MGDIENPAPVSAPPEGGIPVAPQTNVEPSSPLVVETVLVPAGEAALASVPASPVLADIKVVGPAKEDVAKESKSGPPLPPEVQPTIDEIRELWSGKGGAYDMVRQYVEAHGAEYRTNERAKKAYARTQKLDAAKDDDLAKIDAEMTRRKRVLEALEIVEIPVKKKSGWKEGEIKGRYQQVNADGVVLKEVWMHLAYEPILDEVRKLAKETEEIEGAEKPTERAKKAKHILDVLEPRLIPVTIPDGRSGFSIEPNLKNIEIKKAQESSYTYGLHLIDAVLEPFGQKLEYVTDGKPKRKRLKLEAFSNIDPSGELGSRLSRLTILLSQYEEVDISKSPKAQAYLAAMIYDEASQIDISRIKSSRYPKLAEEFAGLNEHKAILYQYRDELVIKVKGIIHEFYKKGTQFDPARIPLLETNLFRDVYFAFVCEDHVGINEKGEMEMEKTLEKALNKGKAAGAVFNSDVDAVIALAGTKQAHIILEEDLGFNLELLKQRKITDYADRVITGIKNKRPDQQMSDVERKNYRAVFEEVQTSAIESVRGSKLASALKLIGMLALILGPSAMGLLTEGSEAEEKRQ